MTFCVGNPGPGLGQANICGRVKLVNGISNGNIDIKKQKIPVQIGYKTITKMNDNTNMDRATVRF